MTDLYLIRFLDHKNLGLANKIVFVSSLVTKLWYVKIYSLFMLIYANWASTLNAQQMELGIWRFLTTGDP